MVSIIAGAAVVLLVLWAASCRRRLTVMDENVNSAMARIGIQLSACFNVLTALSDLIRGYNVQEAQTLSDTVESCRSAVTATSTPADVMKRESVIAEVLERVSVAAERYPELKADENYAKCMNAMDGYEKMMRTSRLIYNNSVTKLNRELRMFPALLLAGVFGFRQREYLAAAKDN